MVKDNVKFNCASQTTLLLYHPELPSTRSPGPQSVVRRCHLLVLASELLSQGPGLLLQGEHLGISLKDLGLKGIDCRVLLRLKLDELDRVEKVKLHMCLSSLLSSSDPAEAVATTSDHICCLPKKVLVGESEPNSGRRGQIAIPWDPLRR